MKKGTEKTWTVEDARDVYNVDHWSDGHFDINDKGELCAKLGESKTEVSFAELVGALKRAGLTLPVLVRFSDILKGSVKKLCQAFDMARNKANYQGNYTCVYPIKVNQHRRVVEQLLRQDKNNVGLEAGSKPELMAVMALSQKGSVIICNGYKDREYIRLALIGRILGQRITLIIEKPSELDLILEESAQMGVEPLLGMRIRLSSIGKGKWQNSGGEKSKFGLTAGQILTVIEKLKQANKLHWLHLIHFHLGSQIANIHDIKKGFAECAQYYAKLHGLGIDITTVDVGGGLGIDYEGTQSRNDCSRNYSVQDYAEAVIEAFTAVCTTYQLKTPHLISESGRALTAHHAVLLTQVIDTDNLYRPHELAAPDEKALPMIQDLWRLQQSVDHVPVVESYHESIGLLTKVHEAFNEGKIQIAEKAFAEDIYYRICTLVRAKLSAENRSQRALLDELNEKLADKLFCNFSLFQSIPDAWAIEQIFPIMPLLGLLEKPTQRAVLQDLTCDSDGRIHYYVDGQGIESSLPLPPSHAGVSQCLGIFLVGAYQEILGDMHNLFGDTDSVHVELDDQGGYQLVEPVLGDRVDRVLQMVHYEPQQLMQSYKQQLENANLLPNERRKYLDMLASGLSGYTYLEEEH